MKDQGRIELHQGGAGANLGVGVGAARHPADADQGQPPCGQPVYVGQNPGGRREQRHAAQAPGLAPTAAGEAGGPLDRGVGGDHPVDAGSQRHFGDVFHVVSGQVRSDLEQDRRPGPAFPLGREDGLEQGLEGPASLERSHPGRVGGGYVDHQVIGEPGQCPRPFRVIGSGVRAVPVDPEVDPDDASARAPPETPGHRFQSVVVET